MTVDDERFIAELRVLLPPPPVSPTAAEVAVQRRAVHDLAGPARRAPRVRSAGMAALVAGLLVTGGAGVAVAADGGSVPGPLRAVAGAIGLSRPADPFADARRDVGEVNDAVGRGDAADAAAAVSALQRQLATLAPEDRARLAPVANAAITAAGELDHDDQDGHGDDLRGPSTTIPGGAVSAAPPAPAAGTRSDDGGSGSGSSGTGTRSDSDGGSTSGTSDGRDGGSGSGEGGSTSTTPTTAGSSGTSGTSGDSVSGGSGGTTRPTTTTTTTPSGGDRSGDGGSGGHDGGGTTSLSGSSGSGG